MAVDEELKEHSSAPDPAYRERYPWHDIAWTALTRELDKLPHALLLRGQAGLGKYAFALRLAHALLCSHTDAVGSVCGDCKSCLLFKAGTHPDLKRITPLEDGKSINVESIRELSDFLVLRPHTAKHKVVIIQPAEAMNAHAANALLKRLEEPPLGSVLLLVSSDPARLPATIRSRCLPITFRCPPAMAAQQWLATRISDAQHATRLLALAGGAPLQALKFATADFLTTSEGLAKDLLALRRGDADPLTCAARWKTSGALTCLKWLQGFLPGLIKTTMVEAGAPAPLDFNKFNIDINSLFSFFDVVSEAKNGLSAPLDEALLLEDVLIRWTRLPTGIVYNKR